jgi:hypothetical protein
MSTYNDAVLAGLFGITGVLLGVLLSFFPSRLIQLKDSAERHLALLRMLRFETSNVLSLCGRHSAPLRTDVQRADARPVHSRVPNFGWEAAMLAGEFIPSLPKKLATELASAYSTVSLANSAFDQFSVYAAVSIATGTYQSSAPTIYKSYLDALTLLADQITNLGPKLDSAIGREQFLVRLYVGLVWTLAVIGVAGVVFLFFWFSRIWTVFA